MKSISSSEMQALDRRAQEEFKIPSFLLMQNAGRGVAEIAQEMCPRGKIFVLCGKGNNGGDGFVAARQLAHQDYEVQVFLFGKPEDLKGDAATAFHLLQSSPNVRIQGQVQASDAEDLSLSFKTADLVIDALFGIGLKKDLTGIHKKAVEDLNQSGKPVLAVDIPSGLDADTGEVRGAAVKAEATATMGFAKHGLLKGKGPEYAGEIIVVDIGFPPQFSEPGRARGRKYSKP